MADSDSDSALSEALDMPNGPPSSINGKLRKPLKSRIEESSGEGSSSNANAVSSDDANYDSDTPLQQASGSTSEAQTSSPGSPQPRKRKNTDTEDYIMNNPELYGLRRSVRRSS